MKKIILRNVGLFCVFVSLFSLFSCKNKNVVSSVKKETLFNLQYGSFENQLNLLNLANTGMIDTSIAMKNGFFYISNGNAKKLLEINSYGDLLTLYYNNETSVAPSLEEAVTTGNENIGASTRKSVSYAFNSPNLVAVDNRQYVYVTETLPKERQEYEDSKALWQIVLRFNSNSFVDYIGQNGPGGLPFPYIRNIYTTADNELVVVCIVMKGLEVYCFSPEGKLIHSVTIESDKVPNPYQKEMEEPMFVTVENIIPDYQDDKLWVKIDYSAVYTNEVSRVNSGIEYLHTLLYPLDITSGVYGEPIEVPAYEESVESDFTKQIYKQPYDFLGVTSNGWFFFSIPTSNGYVIQMINQSQSQVIKRLLPIDHSQIMYSNFNLSDTGIISALLAHRDKAEVVWWRTDLFIDSLLKS